MTVVQLSDQDLRGLHQVQLEMLLEFDRVCRLLDVPYQLGAGSLLGAVRHGGFIPWDDDVDVLMLRTDYRRFLREAPRLLDRRLFLQTWRSDLHFLAGFAKLRLHDSVFREDHLQHSRQHHGIFLDIFPFDPVSPGSRWGCALIALVVLVRKAVDLTAAARNRRLAPECSPWQWKLRPMAQRLQPWMPCLLILAVQATLLRALSLLPGTHVICLVSGSLSSKRVRSLARPAAEFHHTVYLAFEGVRLPVTASYHVALTRLYGDYAQLPPLSSRRARHPVVEFRLPPASQAIDRDRPAQANA
jgi:lipopolysaccharide cholinephosphotransferase